MTRIRCLVGDIDSMKKGMFFFLVLVVILIPVQGQATWSVVHINTTEFRGESAHDPVYFPMAVAAVECASLGYCNGSRSYLALDQVVCKFNETYTYHDAYVALQRSLFQDPPVAWMSLPFRQDATTHLAECVDLWNDHVSRDKIGVERYPPPLVEPVRTWSKSSSLLFLLAMCLLSGMVASISYAIYEYRERHAYARIESEEPRDFNLRTMAKRVTQQWKTNFQTSWRSWTSGKQTVRRHRHSDGPRIRVTSRRIWRRRDSDDASSSTATGYDTDGASTMDEEPLDVPPQL